VRILSVSKLIAWAIDAYVFMKLPAFLCRLLAMHFLGHLSCIYRNVCHTNFRLSSEIAKLAVQMMSSMATFDQLANIENSISLSDMCRRLSWLAKGFREVSTLEVHTFVAMIFMVVLGMDGKMRRIVDRNHKITEEEIHQDLIFSSKVGMKEFMLASFSSSRIDLLQIVKLMDQDRTLGPLERLFLPEVIRGLRLGDGKAEMLEDTMMQTCELRGSSILSSSSTPSSAVDMYQKPVGDSPTPELHAVFRQHFQH